MPTTRSHGPRKDSYIVESYKYISQSIQCSVYTNTRQTPVSYIPSSDFQCCFEQGSVKKCTKATSFLLRCSKTLDIPADDCTCRLCGIWAMMWYVFSLLYCFGRSFIRVMPYHLMILIFTLPSSLQVSPGHVPKRPVDAQILLVVYALPAYVADITPALLNVTAELQT